MAATFDAGRIIDDSIFTNKSSMLVGDIQNFLNSKVPACDTWHTAGPSAQGAVPPWTCLKDYYENISTGANNLNGQPVPTGSISAAQIIYNAAQTYSINPQVLLVTLQKENGLITDTWPYPWQYRTAMGFACPDNGTCDPAYYGFYKQVNQAARHFRNFYDLNPTWTIPFRPGSNYIQYNPNASCGGTTVNIQNNATAALYSYTPYQPNAAALNNLYGTGDSCSAYGNRNFWRDFTNWFGTTLAPNTNWRFEKLDGSSDSISSTNANVGPNPSSLLFNGDLYVFYYDVTNGNLRMALNDPTTGWNITTHDGQGGSAGRLDAKIGLFPSAVIYDNQLHVFYYDSANGNLRHSWSDSNGNNWQFETLDGGGGVSGRIEADLGITPAAVEKDGILQVFYYDQTNNNLRHAWFVPGNTWKFENMDGDSGAVSRNNANVGIHPSVIKYGTTLQLFYYDQTGGNMRHAWEDSTYGWRFENLEGRGSQVSRYKQYVGLDSNVLTYGNTIQLFYYDLSTADLIHAFYSPDGGWGFERLDGSFNSLSKNSSSVGYWPSSTVYNNTIQLVYYDSSNGDLRHAFYSPAGGWGFESLDGSSNNSVNFYSANVGLQSTITNYLNTIQTFYLDASNGDLRHAWWTP